MRWACAVLIFCLLLSGCSTVGVVTGVVTQIASNALETAGLKKPEIPELQKPPRQVSLKLHAGNNLNAGNTATPLSVIARVYKLKQTGAFYSAPYETFLSPDKEKEVLGSDLIEVKEVSLIPGQLYEVKERVSRESGYIGVIALFRTPAPQRWRAAFSAAEAESAGVTLALHACSLTLGQGALTDQSNVLAASSTPATCR